MRNHRVTLVVMMLVSGILLGLNLVAWRYHLTAHTIQHLGSCWYGYGWPAPFARQIEPDLITALTRDLRQFPFMIDFGFAAFLTLGAGWICESWLELRALMGGCQARLSARLHR